MPLVFHVFIAVAVMVMVCGRHGISQLLAGALPGRLGQLSLPSPGVGKSSTNLLAGVKAGRVHLFQVAGNTV